MSARAKSSRDERPADTLRPTDIPRALWWRIGVRAFRNGSQDNLNVLAAGISFYAFLALIPFLASIATIYGLFAKEGAVVADIESVLSILPSEAHGLLAERIEQVVAGSSVGPLGLALALLLAAYSAARGARSIVSGLNVMLRRHPRARAVQRWMVAVVIALIGAGLMMLALLAIAIHSAVEHLLPVGARSYYALVQILFWLFLGAGVGAGLAVLYRYGPAGQKTPWRWLLPGAAAATLAWLAGSFAFGAYVATFDRLDRTYGPLAAVVVLQLWLHLSAFALLFGAKLNFEAERQARSIQARKRTRERSSSGAQDRGEKLA